MDRENTDPTRRRWLLALGVLLTGLLVLGAGAANAAGPTGNLPKGDSALVDGAAPLTQQFEDVPDSNPFSTFINALYVDSVVSGYACGSVNPPEPCVPPLDRPYYRPNNTVTRAQMAKFVDNGRRNIADATGHSLYISTTAGIAIDAETRSGGEAVYAQCLQSGNNCYALEGYAPTGDYALYAYGGKGAYLESDDASQPAVDATSYGSGAYALQAESSVYRGGYVKSDSNALNSLYVDTRDGPNQGTAGLEVNGSIRGEGNLYIAGSKAGYVVDIMQNVGTEILEPGDVVTIVGSSTPVLGQIPVVTVKKATLAYDPGVAGIVDEVMYAPDASTKAAYDKQEEELRSAMAQRQQLTAAAEAKGVKPDLSAISMPSASITDEQGTLHAIPGATQVVVNGFASVVTLGSYKAVKVDASFGPIHAGDLLTTSPHAGYAMKATDKLAATGAVIGKALGSLENGTRTIAILVTLK